MQAVTPVTPLQAGGEMFQRTKTPSVFDVRASPERPMSQMSEATEIFDTDFEDDSEYGGNSPKPSFDSEDSRRRSQTTISSYDEVPTPSPRASEQRAPFDLRLDLRPVEGPKGPHLFRSSQVSAEFDFDFALQMSPMLPKEMSFRTETAYSGETATPVNPRHPDYSLDAALQRRQSEPFDPEAHIRSWSTQHVIDWMYETGIDSSVIECFDIHDINGAVLLDLQFDDLRELDIQSFGKRHQLWNAICLLRGEDGLISPQQTPFQDIDRPCTAPPPRSSSRRRSPSRGRICSTPIDGLQAPPTPTGGKKRRGRKESSKTRDIVMPAESVSIVAIEQLLPKPHKCAKGERCAKWRKQQRELKLLQEEHGIGTFPISPSKGGRIFVAGDPGNASNAEKVLPNVHKQPVQRSAQPTEEEPRPVSEAQPSVVASSDLLGPGQVPEFALHEDMLNQLGSRNAQDNVKEFLQFQHMHSPVEPPHAHYGPPSPPLEMFPSNSFTPYPAQQTQPPLQPPHTVAPHEQLRSLPRLNIPRSASAGPDLNTVATPEPTTSICRSATASPGMQMMYRLGTPASEMDVPVTAVPNGPLARDASQSVPPNMQYRQQQPLARSHSRGASDAPSSWRRPSMQLPALQEHEVFSPESSPLKRPSTVAPTSALHRSSSIHNPDPNAPLPTKHFGYGSDCSHSGWMKKRKTKILRHEWTDAHFRLKGTQLAMHANARLSSAELNSFNVDDYAVACSSGPSNSKLQAAIKALRIKDDAKKAHDDTAFAFQLIPEAEKTKSRRDSATDGKTHHFAVKTKDERIEWMRELMIAKALQQKGKGYEVEVNGVQH